MSLILVDLPAQHKPARRLPSRPWWLELANWLVIVGCALGAGWVFLGAAGWR